MTAETVLVTGGSGFLANWCLVQLLERGYQVRTTVRGLDRAQGVRDALERAGAPRIDSLSFVVANLLDDAGWSDAVSGCDFVLHVASPFPARAPKDPDELIVPARDGALRVLQAAANAGVRRVVLTSSFAAIGYGHPPLASPATNAEHPFTEQDWTDVTARGVGAYQISKTLAEQAAWGFIAASNTGLELAVVNPVGVLGPALGRPFSTSVRLVAELLGGRLPALPKSFVNVVDVRDVADLHLRAMTDPRAAGERFLATSGAPVSLQEMVRVLRDRMPQASLPRFVVPDPLMRAAAMIVPSLRPLVPQPGGDRPASSQKARRLLGWSPRSGEEAVLATGESLLGLGVLPADGTTGRGRRSDGAHR